MNNVFTYSLRAAALASANDTACQVLATSGIIPVKAAGPYVQVGSYRIHVLSHLGRPSAVLANGAWLYRGFSADESAASGALVVRFDHGRVIQRSLVSPGVETAMLTAPANAKGQTLIASK